MIYTSNTLLLDAFSFVLLFALVIVYKLGLPWITTFYRRRAGLIPYPEDTSLPQVIKDVVAVAKMHNFKPTRSLSAIIISSILSIPAFSLSMYMMSIYMGRSSPIINIVILLGILLSSIIHHYIDLSSALGNYGHC